MSPALRVALSMALMRAPWSEAAFSRSALEDLGGDVERQKLGQDFGLVWLVFVDRAAKVVLDGAERWGWWRESSAARWESG